MLWDVVGYTCASGCVIAAPFPHTQLCSPGNRWHFFCLYKSDTMSSSAQLSSAVCQPYQTQLHQAKWAAYVSAKKSNFTPIKSYNNRICDSVSSAPSILPTAETMWYNEVMDMCNAVLLILFRGPAWSLSKSSKSQQPMTGKLNEKNEYLECLLSFSVRRIKKVSEKQRERNTLLGERRNKHRAAVEKAR